MEKLRTQDVLLPTVGTIDTLHGDIKDLIYNCFIKKESDKYILTKSEIIKLVGDAFEAGETYGYDLSDSSHDGTFPTETDKQTYIDNLFK